MAPPQRPRPAHVGALSALSAACLLAWASGEVEKEYSWRFSKWSNCSDLCGRGVTARTLQCMERQGEFQKATLQSRCREANLTEPKGELEVRCYGVAPTVEFCASCSKQAICARCVEGFNLVDGGSRCHNARQEIILDMHAKGPADFEWHAKWRPDLDLCAQAIANATQTAKNSTEPIVARVAAVLPTEEREEPKEEVATKRRLSESWPSYPASLVRIVVTVPTNITMFKFKREIIRAAKMVGEGLVTHPKCPDGLMFVKQRSMLPNGRSTRRKPRPRGTTPPWVWAVIIVSITIGGLLVFYALENHHKVRAMEIMLEATTYATTHRGITPGAAELDLRPK